MTIQLKDGGTYARADGTEHRVSFCAGDAYPWHGLLGATYKDGGYYYGSGDVSNLDLIRVVSEPSVTPVDPIAHMFVDVPAVPASREFVGGRVIPLVRLRICGPSEIGLVNQMGHETPMHTSEARILAAALIAAADAIDPKD